MNAFIDSRVCHQRRQRLASKLGDSVLVLGGGQLKTRSNDTEFRFRPDSDFYYLTGLSEPGAVLVFRPGRTPETVLFVRPRDEKLETWTGRRIGPEGALERHGADRAYGLGELSKQLPDLVDGAPTVYFQLGRYRKLQSMILNATSELKRRNREGTAPPEGILDVAELLGEERLRKDDAALAALRHAVDISADAHVAAMRAVRPGAHEFQVEAMLEYEFRVAGSTGPGYGSIVGGGDNATILHYVDNSERLEDGDLLLVDAGCEWDFFTGDITRTYPVSGRFSGSQRALYDLVLEANEAAIRQCKVGANINAIHDDCVKTLSQGFIDLGLLSGSLDEVIEKETFKRFYMHRTSHWLGVDVHDVGAYSRERKPRPLQPGFVLTIEPGVYIRADDESVPESFRGIGVRVEDDVLVAEDGPEVLSHRVPKQADELEEIVGSGEPFPSV